MSFILDALKKLEREKENRDPDVVMVGPVPWGGRDRTRRGRKLALSGVAVAVLVAGALWATRRGTPPPSETAKEVHPSVPAPSPTPSTTPSPEAALAPPLASPDTASLEPPPRRPLSLPGAEAAPPAEGGPTDPGLSTRHGTPEATSPPDESEEPTSAVAEAGDTDDPAAEAATDEGPVEFRLSAISSRDGEPVALLNDRLVREGDAFDGVRILRIGTAEVEIEVGGERRTIGF